MKGIEGLFIVMWMLFAIYVAVLLLIGADLWSGVRKARARHEARTSEGYKRTIDKIARYYNMLLALTVVDAMQMVGVWYLDSYYSSTIPIFPAITMLGAIGIGVVEVKSIYEKAEDKERARYADAVKMLAKLVRDSKEPYKVITDVAESLGKEVEK